MPHRNDGQQQQQQRHQGGGGTTPRHLLSTNSKHCWTTNFGGANAQQRKTSAGTAEVPAAPTETIGGPSTPRMTASSALTTSTTTTTAKVILGGGNPSLPPENNRQRHISREMPPPSATFLLQESTSSSSSGISSISTLASSSQRVLVVDPPPATPLPAPPLPPPSSMSSCCSSASSSSIPSTTATFSGIATAAASSASTTSSSCSTGRRSVSSTARPSLIFDFPSSSSSFAMPAPFTSTTFTSFVPSASSPVPSPSHTPQWRHPSSSSTSSSLVTIVSAGGATATSGVGRAMPKSALLMSKCQVFLKNNGSSTNLASPKQWERTASTESAEPGGKRSEIPSQTETTIGENDEEKSTMEDKGGEEGDSCKTIRNDERKGSGLEEIQTTEMNTAKGAPDAAVPTMRSSAVASKCIFNFEEAVMFLEKIDEEEEKEAVQKTVEEILRWLDESAVEIMKEQEMTGNEKRKRIERKFGADEGKKTIEKGSFENANDDSLVPPVTEERRKSEGISKMPETKILDEKKQEETTAADISSTLTAPFLPECSPSAAQTLESEQTQRVDSDESKEYPPEYKEAEKTGRTEENDADEDGDCILAILHKKNAESSEEVENSEEGGQKHWTDNTVPMPTVELEVVFHFADGKQPERALECGMNWPVPSVDSCCIQIAKVEKKGKEEKHYEMPMPIEATQAASCHETETPTKAVASDGMRPEMIKEAEMPSLPSASENAIMDREQQQQQDEHNTAPTTAAATPATTSMMQPKKSGRRRAHPVPSPLPLIQAEHQPHAHHHSQPHAAHPPHLHHPSHPMDMADGTPPLSSCCSSIASTSRAAIPPPLLPLQTPQSSPRPSSGSNTSRLVERLRIVGMQLRNVQCCGWPDAQVAVGIRLDGREMFRSAVVQLHGRSCVIGEEFCMEEMPRHFQCLQLSLFELVDGARAQRLVGRVRLGRKELLELGSSSVGGSVSGLPQKEQVDRHHQTQPAAAASQQQPQQQQQQNGPCWLPIARVRPSTEFSQVLGSLCVQLEWNEQSRVLTLSVLDLTTWALAGNAPNPLERYCQEGGTSAGRLHLKLCVAFGRSGFTAMQRIRLSERRGLEQARFDCSPFVHYGHSSSATSANAAAVAPGVSGFFLSPTPHSPRSMAAAEQSAGEWLSGLSACSSPNCATPSWAKNAGAGGQQQTSLHSPRRNASRQYFHFPPPSPLSKCSNSSSGRLLTPGGRSSAGGGAQQQQQGMPPSSAPPISPLPPWMQEPRVHIKVYGTTATAHSGGNAAGGGGGAGEGKDSYCGSVRISLDQERMQPREATHRGPNWFNIRSRTTHKFFQPGKNDPTSKRPTTALNSPTPILKNSQLHQQQQPKHKRFSQPPSSPPIRHCSTPSTSSTKTTGATPPHKAVVSTRSDSPLNTTSIASLFSSSAGYSVAKGISAGLPPPPAMFRNSIESQQRQEENQQVQRHSFADSDITNMGNQQHLSAENIIGEIRLKFSYNTDEVLPLVHYQPLYLNLIRSLNVTPYSHSLISLIQCLPIDIEKLAKPLMKIFIHSNQIRLFFRLICSEYLSTCRDVNTLFRSQSLASKVLYEMMKFVGNKYLIASLKPLIDLIYAERKSCEIDPSKLKPGESLERNFCNITVYAELAFSRVVDSRQRCPQALRELFAELRDVVQEFFPEREDVSRLAVSSFLIMRFFAAAILNPKLFALKLETPDIDVSRTLVLVSKILQRLANCVVSAHPLTTKEQWLTPVLQRFLDDAHKSAMINFLDDVSTSSGNGANRKADAAQKLGEQQMQVQSINDEEEDGGGNELAMAMMVNNENALPPSTPTTFFCGPSVLKSGYLIERRFGSVKKRSFKNFIHPKRRLVVLTENTLNWHKTSSKESAQMINSLNMSEQQQHHHIGGGGEQVAQQQQKSHINLADVTSVSAIMNAKNSFRVATVNTEVHFQANSDVEMNEWIILIQKQQRRHLMLLNRPYDYSQMSTAQAAAEVDIERELHTVYSQLAEHFDSLCEWGWCCRHGECQQCGGNDAAAVTMADVGGGGKHQQRQEPQVAVVVEEGEGGGTDVEIT